MLEITVKYNPGQDIDEHFIEYLDNESTFH